MSGTSTDGVDGVVAQFAPNQTCRVVASAFIPFREPLKSRLLALQRVGVAQTTGEDPFLMLEQAINGLTDAYSACAAQLYGRLDVHDRPFLRAAGAHGQTLRHRPDLGVTMQHFNPARFHIQTSISVVSDFRRADVALGGQGAPLVPAFHRWWLKGQNQRQGITVVLNVGGFANLSCVSEQAVTGFDAGPGNVLMDGWVQRHLGQAYDSNGQWAAKGQVLPVLLDRLLAHPFFARPIPRSTGRDDFHLDWLDGVLQTMPACAPADVQATLMALTVRSVMACVPAGCTQMLVCGGGAFNGGLMKALAEALPSVRVVSTAALGVPPDQMEALAFAWLARQRLCGLPGNLPSVTGASASVLLGSLTGL